MSIAPLPVLCKVFFSNPANAHFKQSRPLTHRLSCHLTNGLKSEQNPLNVCYAENPIVSECIALRKLKKIVAVLLHDILPYVKSMSFKTWMLCVMRILTWMILFFFPEVGRITKQTNTNKSLSKRYWLRLNVRPLFASVYTIAQLFVFFQSFSGTKMRNVGKVQILSKTPPNSYDKGPCSCIIVKILTLY